MQDFIKSKKLTLILLLIIIFLGSILRLWQLGNTPSSLNWDEVALGYDAYSISLTGKDEFGVKFPIILRSFDDYKPALFAYLIIPTYKIFGLNAFAVRFPSAFFGILTLVSVFFLVKFLFNRRDLALLSTFILAISPWHIQFSRVAFESNVGLALNVFAATLFVYGLKKHWLLILSAIFAGLSIHTYQSEKVFTPIFMIGLFIIYFVPLMRVPKKYLLASFVLGFLVVLPLLIYLKNDSNALLRAKGTSIFSNNTVMLKENAKRNEYNLGVHNTFGKILDNRRIVYFQNIANGYLAHFDPNWLLKGDIGRHHAPDMGLIYIWEFPFILIGIYTLIFSKFKKRTKFLIFFWFMLAPIPASVTREIPHAVRTLNFLPTWQIFTALGLWSSFIFFKNLSIANIYKRVLFGVFLLFTMFNFVYYMDQYFIQLNYFNAREWIYGYQQIIPKVLAKEDKFDKVVISDKAPMDKSYMFFLFFSKYPPEKYQLSKSPSGNFKTHQKFGKYEFRPINWEKDSQTKNTLFVGTPEEIEKKNAIETIYYPDGQPVMVMASTK